MKGHNLKRSALAALLLLSTGSPATAGISIPAQGENTGVIGPTTANTSIENSAVAGARAQDPYYEPKGIPLAQGSPFRLFPNLFLAGSYDDNVFRVPSYSVPGKQGDVYWTLNPTLALDYTISRLNLDLYGNLTNYEYDTLGQVDITNFKTGIAGTYAGPSGQLSANLSYGEFSEAMSSADTSGFQAHATQYLSDDLSGKYSFKPNRLGIVVGGSYDTYDYLSVPLIGGGPPLINTDRNNQITTAFVESSYNFSPGYSVFVRSTYNNDHYSSFFDRSGLHRSSHGYEVDAGAYLLLGDLIQGEAYAGYLEQLYDMHQLQPLKDISGVDFGANVTWYPTQLLIMQVNAARQLLNTTLNGAAAGDDRYVNLNADYELSRTLHLTGIVGYDDTNYSGDINHRDDRTLSTGVGAKWLMNHYLWWSLNYQYQLRSDANVPAARYNDDSITLGLNVQD